MAYWLPPKLFCPDCTLVDFRKKTLWGLDWQFKDCKLASVSHLPVQTSQQSLECCTKEKISLCELGREQRGTEGSTRQQLGFMHTASIHGLTLHPNQVIKFREMWRGKNTAGWEQIFIIIYTVICIAPLVCMVLYNKNRWCKAKFLNRWVATPEVVTSRFPGGVTSRLHCANRILSWHPQDIWLRMCYELWCLMPKKSL